MTDTFPREINLDDVRQAAEEKRLANRTYRAMVTEARKHHRTTDIAQAAGVTRQAVLALTKEKK